VSKVVISNHTILPIESKIDQLYTCLQHMFSHDAVEPSSLICEELGYPTPNFTTAGIYRMHGVAAVRQEQRPWSLILKVIKQDSHEKEDSQHHNYWRREALVMNSKLLESLPDSIQAAKSYLVEEQKDGTIWLWMEHVEGQYAESQEQFEFIAHQLGRFNGAYLMGKALPQQEWLCRGWLRSWITASRLYAPNPEVYIKQIQKGTERSLWDWFQGFNETIEYRLLSLEQLPRVLAHQDLSQMNMLLANHKGKINRLVWIDWQFMSLSGIGEDLGKMFGVNMSLGVIPPDQYQAFQASLFSAYIEGLKEMGWQGDESLARYGYCLSTALRSVWEVPKYIVMAAQLDQEPENTLLKQSVAQLERVIIIHREMAFEADALKVFV
jgi:hypothetical protein